MSTFIAGPCVIESMELMDTVAQELVRIKHKLGTDNKYVYYTQMTLPTNQQL